MEFWSASAILVFISVVEIDERVQQILLWKFGSRPSFCFFLLNLTLACFWNWRFLMSIRNALLKGDCNYQPYKLVLGEGLFSSHIVDLQFIWDHSIQWLLNIQFQILLSCLIPYLCLFNFYRPLVNRDMHSQVQLQLPLHPRLWLQHSNLLLPRHIMAVITELVL